jgi:hypothetical protein
MEEKALVKREEGTPPQILQARIEEKLVEELLEKALLRLEDIMDSAEDDALVQKTATYIVDLAKEISGLKKSGGGERSPGVNVAIFSNPGYVKKMSEAAQHILEGEVIDVEVE